MIRHLLISCIALLCIMFIGRIGVEAGIALADSGAPAVTDAGASSSSGSGSAAAAVPTTSTMHDPATAPLQSLGDVSTLWKLGGWPLAVLGAMYLLLELAAIFGKKTSIAALAWLGKGRVSTVIAGATAIAAAALNAVGAGGAWSAALAAAAVAGLAYWHPAGTDPAKS